MASPINTGQYHGLVVKDRSENLLNKNDRLFSGLCFESTIIPPANNQKTNGSI